MTIPEVRAAGAVLWRASDSHRAEADRTEVALVHRPRYDDWSLPKGKLDPGETAPAAAVREIAEETGFDAALGRRLGSVEYRLANGKEKSVDYFAAYATRGEFAANEEVDRMRWLPVAAALETVDYDGDRAMLREFRSASPETATVLLVRHADAGSRCDADSDDERRPLTAIGRRQADALRSLLALFHPTSVHSAPPRRCLQTVEAVAHDLGTDIEREPLVAEDGYWARSAAALTRLYEIAATPDPGGATVVSSQGGAIPDLVAACARDAGLRLDDVPCRKGSLWVLSFNRGPGGPVLTAADYYAGALPGS